MKFSKKVIIGIILIFLSYILGWPVVALLSYLSYYFNKPLIIVIGGPIMYGISWLVLWLGLYLSGKEYIKKIIDWIKKCILKI